MGAMMSPLGIDFAGLDALMPMSVIIGLDHRIQHAGPTIRKLRPKAEWVGEQFQEVFNVRRPRDFCLAEAARSNEAAITLHVQLAVEAKTPLKGVLANLPNGAGAVINFGFGIGVVDAVRDYVLSANDFAPTDLTIEMLYLVEAKSAVMEESRNLNRRLQIAKRAAELQAKTDPLTGVKNRRALEMDLDRLIEEGLPFGLMLIDLDFFKKVNDTFGHAAGDHVLKVVAQILTDEIRHSDVIARVGGDEFVLALPDMTTEAALNAMGERIISRISEPIYYEGRACEVSASIGSTRTTLYDNPSIEQMTLDADAALYRSKGEGRSRHICASHTPEADAFRRANERRAKA